MQPAGDVAVDPLGWPVLEHAYHRPDEVAARWRAGGGRVIGVLGASVPRALLLASGVLPIRLAPSRLPSNPSVAPSPLMSAPTLPEELAPELPPPARRILAAWWGGALSWVDALVVGRDHESDAQLFAILRELVQSGEVTDRPAVAFVDLLRIATPAAAEYNCRQAEKLLAVGGGFGREVGTDRLRDVAREWGDLVQRITALMSARTAEPPRLSGRQALILVGAASTLPLPLLAACVAQLEGAVAAGAPCSAGSSGGSPRVWVTGSGLDEPSGYERLERAGVHVVGEDHEWGPSALTAEAPASGPGLISPSRGGDPSRPDSDRAATVAALVGQHAAALAGSARTGLAARTDHTVSAAIAAGATAVLQIVHGYDGASGWERPALRSAVAAAGLIFHTVGLSEAPGDEAALDAVAVRLREDHALAP